MTPRYLVVMGVTGSGKTTLAERLARELGWPFVEGDTLHPKANIDKMQRGQALDDADRAPWLDAVAQTLQCWRRDGCPGVLSCSALKRAYRERIAGGQTDVLFVYLHGGRELLARRLQGRQGHFMPAGLLNSQLATLEAPDPGQESVLRLDVSASPEALVRSVIRCLAGHCQPEA